MEIQLPNGALGKLVELTGGRYQWSFTADEKSDMWDIVWTAENRNQAMSTLHTLAQSYSRYN